MTTYDPPVRHPFLHGLAGGAGATTAAVVFAVFAMSVPVFVVTLLVTGLAVLVARPLSFARVGGVLAGVTGALALSFAALVAYLSHAGL